MRTARPTGPSRKAAARPLSSKVQTLRAVCVAVAGFVAALSDAAPTGIPMWDVVLKFAFGAAVTYIGSRAHPYAILALALVPILFGWSTLWVLCGAIAALIITKTVTGINWLREAERLDVAYSAAATVFAVQLALRMQGGPFFGFTAVLTALLVTGLAVTAWLRSDPDGRRFGLWALAAIAAPVVLILLVSVVMLPSGRDSASDAAYAVERGLEAASAGDPEDAERYLERADSAFESAEGRFSSLLVQPGRLIPILSQNIAALEIAAQNGSALTDAGMDVANSINIDDLIRPNGGFAIDDLAAAKPQLEEALRIVEASSDEFAATDSPWLMQSLATRLDEASGQLDESVASTRRAVAATEAIPELFGQDRPQHYLVLFGMPTEARELGGAMTSFALLKTEDGRITTVASGPWADLQSEAIRHGGLNHPDGYPEFFLVNDPAIELSNLTALPSMADVARATADIFPTLFDNRLDGVIYLDPAGLSALLELVGPKTPEEGLTLSGYNVADYFLFEQDTETTDAQRRQQVLDSLLSDVFTDLGTAPIPALSELGNIVGPAGRGKHLQIATFNESTNDFLRSIDLLHDFAPQSDQDFLSVTSVNKDGVALDAWIDRTIRYEARVDAVTGLLEADVTVRLKSRAQSNLLPGQHQTDVVVWTPHQLTEVLIDGVRTGFTATDSYNLNRYVVSAPLDPLASREVLFLLNGRSNAPASYALHVEPYPGATVDRFSADIRRSDGSFVDESTLLNEAVQVTLPVLTARAPS